MSELTVFEIEQQYHHLAEQGAYAEALELATREAHQFPPYAQRIVYYWRFRMAALLNDADLTLRLLSQAVEGGHWYHGLHEEDEFGLIHDLPEFARLVEICEQRRRTAMATAVPVMKTMRPEHLPPPYPLLFALHGNNSSVERFAGHWQAAVRHGWYVALPQSSQSYAPDTYSWNDWDWSIQEVRERYATLLAEQPIHPTQTVVAGFSMGGGLAVSLVLSGQISPKGLLLIGPFLQDADSTIPYLEARPCDGLRAYLVGNERDRYCLGVARRLAELLPRYGVECRLEEYADLAHNLPAPFENKLPDVLSWVMQGA
jgi:predicted esterase